MIGIRCDACKERFRTADGFTCFTDDENGDYIREEAESSEWITIGDKHYCPDCYKVDENDHIVTKDGHIYDYETHEMIQ